MSWGSMRREKWDVTGEEEVEGDDYDEEGGEAICVVGRVVPHRRREEEEEWMCVWRHRDRDVPSPQGSARTSHEKG